MKILRLKRVLVFLIILVYTTQKVASQNAFPVPENNTVKYFENHITLLAADSLEGRLTGTRGEQIAMQYISNQFKSIGLTPKGSDQFIQSFDFTFSRDIKVEKLIVGGELKGFYPLSESGSGHMKAEAILVGFGIHAPGLNYSDYQDTIGIRNKIFVIHLSSPDGVHPHSKYREYSDIKTKIKTAIEFGASGIIFYNTDPNLEAPSKTIDIKGWQADIPVVFLNDETVSGEKLDGLAVELSLEITRNIRTGNNVVGYIDNRAENTVIIGAHYDHLGYGEIGSLYANSEKLVHNGADDNASGTAMLIELARSLSWGNLTGNNYLFIAFSGEELGLFGSAYYAKNSTINLSQANYMINMDMVGRLNPYTRNLSINGVGTSPLWVEYLTKVCDTNEIKMKTTESGVGPSDHTSFYLENIPVLHFFTGLHEDYHKPADDEEKINYTGMNSVYNLILSLIKELDQVEKIGFSKTKDQESGKAPKLSVTLGIIPDYMYDGGGVRLDGVREGKPAFNAGLLRGDTIVSIGDTAVDTMQDYMKALSNYHPGDSVRVRIIRIEDELEFEVVF